MATIFSRGSPFSGTIYTRTEKVHFRRCPWSQDPFFKNSWEDFDRLRQDMVKESKEFWNKAEAIQMEERPKTAEAGAAAAAAPPTTPMFFPVRFEVWGFHK